MKIKLSSIMVENQATAIAFYIDILGFKKSKDIPVGEFRWLTVVSPDGYPDVELVLEPNANPAAKSFSRSEKLLLFRNPSHKRKAPRDQARG